MIRSVCSHSILDTHGFICLVGGDEPTIRMKLAANSFGAVASL